MSITVRVSRKAFRKLVAENGAHCAFNTFRHQLTDYDFKYRSGRHDYLMLAKAVAAAALALAADLPGMKQVVAEYLTKAARDYASTETLQYWNTRAACAAPASATATIS